MGKEITYRFLVGLLFSCRFLVRFVVFLSFYCKVLVDVTSGEPANRRTDLLTVLMIPP